MQVPPLLATWAPSRRHPASSETPAAAHAPPGGGAGRQRLGEFLCTHSGEILAAWDEFAATVNHGGQALDQRGLRDHAAEILSAIALDLSQPQSVAQQDAKGKGLAPPNRYPTPAETHADFRMVAGFAVDAMITEYRALRASVLKIWAQDGGGSTAADLADLTRFNEAIDQAIAESVARYTIQTRKATELFIGILGHDIRNPLGTIVVRADYLVRSGQLTAVAAAPIVNAAVRIRGIIEQVVDFTRAQTDGVMPIARVPGDLAAQFSKLVEEARVRHPDRVVRLEGSGDFTGSWDEGRMGQLLSNLLGNALLYGSADQDVTVRMWAAPAEVSFSVHNRGRPIPPADRERIFQPLLRGAHGTAQRQEDMGLGLGLYICREIVRSHGGTLDLESSEAGGTTFSVSLPRAAAADAAVLAAA
jgi:signal transduction histidine kinase